MKAQLKALIERWEAEADKVSALADFSIKHGNIIFGHRLTTKIDVIRSMAAELRQEIKAAEEADREEYGRYMSDIPCQERDTRTQPITHCQKCGEYRYHGHECKNKIDNTPKLE